jgi:hypothetical protein
LWRLKRLLRCYINKIQGQLLPPPWVTARCHWCNQRALVDESGVLELIWGGIVGHRKRFQCLGHFVWHHPATVTCTWLFWKLW